MDDNTENISVYLWYPHYRILVKENNEYSSSTIIIISSISGTVDVCHSWSEECF